jgi:hypothetical protein
LRCINTRKEIVVTLAGYYLRGIALDVGDGGIIWGIVWGGGMK